jgi:hypothetical protein
MKLKAYCEWCWSRIDKDSIYTLYDPPSMFCSKRCKKEEHAFRVNFADRMLADLYTDRQVALQVKLPNLKQLKAR